MRRLRRHSGFTALELIIVMAIIGVLATIFSQALPFLQQRSRNTARVAALANLKRIIELYHTDNGNYPTAGAVGATFSYFTAAADPWVTANYAGSTITNNYIPGIVPTYYEALPVDPAPGPSTLPGCSGLGFQRNWGYVTNGDHYKLIVNCASETNLIDVADSFVDPSGVSCVPVGVGPCTAWAISDNMDYATNVLGWP